MNLDRIELLKRYFEDDPDDPFNAYALALEFAKTNYQEANHFFQLLLSRHEHYVPTYYQAGKFYQDNNDTSKATELFEKGIRVAKLQNDHKAARELKSALDELLTD